MNFCKGCYSCIIPCGREEGVVDLEKIAYKYIKENFEIEEGRFNDLSFTGHALVDAFTLGYDVAKKEESNKKLEEYLESNNKL